MGTAGFFDLTLDAERLKLMKNYIRFTTKTKVGGKMSEKGADRAGLLQAIAWLILSISVLVGVIGFFY
ncbi:hypothetical protein B0181_10530 [Moraxella caviae]|uniref:Uncharacterized protein n=2 Tax=Moraxella caviae TaxID=34060 RepID=A0A1S9ZV73_9GAMM|nr:hypothetical protein B0181_10530 [Moraxella caviae]